MKTIKVFLTGMLLAAAISFTCYGQDKSVTDIINSVASLTTSASTTSNTVPDLLGSIQSYIDPTILQNFKNAFEANQTSALPSTPEGFLLDYMTKYPEFSQAVTGALDKAKKDKGITTDSQLSQGLVDQLKDLKKQIDDNKNLTDDQKNQYNDLLKKYNDTAQQMQAQIANSNNALNKALNNLTKPQQQDPTMMIMMILMMVMQMMKGGGGGGACGAGAGGSCGG